MNLSGHTKPFAVLGHPIGHTLSPKMHNAAFAALGMDAVYLAFDVLPARLMAVLGAMRDMGFAGVNLTVPHKEVALRGLAQLDDSARLLGAVNTVQFTETGAVGYNTDGHGFLCAFAEAFARDLRGMPLLVVGTGGAGRAVALVAARAGAGPIVLADLDGTRARAAGREILDACPGTGVEIVDDAAAFDAAARTADLVVHATPIGMKASDESVLGPAAFREGQCVLDLIYHFPETAVMKTARAGGARAANGLGMLMHQGARAFEIWTGTPPPLEVMRSALEESVYAS